MRQRRRACPDAWPRRPPGQRQPRPAHGRHVARLQPHHGQPELSLRELAQHLRTSPGLLSKVINTGCGQNFNDFVNTYRVAEARRKLQDPAFAHYSLLGVALESGFNSKSTFNRVFKKLAGQAPGELKRPKS